MLSRSFLFVSVVTASVLICKNMNKSYAPISKQTTATTTGNFDWLLGTWKMPAKNGVLYEYWEKKDNRYQNKGYKVSNTGDTMILETVQIIQKGDTAYYVPTTRYQNDQKAVYFKMTTVSATSFIAENPAHDFPQRITYRLTQDRGLYVMIDGKVGGEYRKEEFSFSKLKSEK